MEKRALATASSFLFWEAIMYLAPACYIIVFSLFVLALLDPDAVEECVQFLNAILN